MSYELPSIALIELHDARMRSLRLDLGGKADLEFTHLVVFTRSAVGGYDVWSYSACLSLHGVSLLELSGELAKDDYIAAARLTDSAEEELPVEQLLTGGQVRRVILEFAAGAKVTINCKSGRLDLVDKLRFLEEWEGPLTSPAG